MRLFVLMLMSALLPASAMALPIVGEKVTYTGTALKNDGLYDVTMSTEVVSFDPQKLEYSVKNTFEQSAEGSPMGGYDDVEQVAGRDYFGIERALPQLMLECGSLKSQDPSQRMVTNREVLSTPIGDLETCRLDGAYNVKNGTQVTQWFSVKTAPWPARTRVVNLKSGLLVETTIQSLSRPTPKPAEAPKTEAPAQPEPPKEEGPQAKIPKGMKRLLQPNLNPMFDYFSRR